MIGSPQIATVAIFLGWFLAPSLLPSDDAPKERRHPGEFAIIFNMGYAGDSFPQDPENFEKLVVAAKEAHYNVLLCKYEDWRAEICERHGMKIMVDLLVPDHHVYKNPEGAEKLCKGLRGSQTVYAYHLWSDRIGGTIAGRSRDVKNVHVWDPNHPTYVGSYNGRAIGDLENADLIGFYDFHWKRLGLWRHLNRMADAARKTGSLFLRYADGAPGRIGAGNYNRVFYTISMSAAFGQKGHMFHFTGGEIDKATWKWKALGDDLAKVNAEVALLGQELLKIGNPVAVYSTPTTRTAKDRDTGHGKPTVPDGLTPVPGDSWLQVKAGEAVVGVFETAESHPALVFANHNAYQSQSMEVELKGAKNVRLFDRQTGTWKSLNLAGGVVKFAIPPAAPELLLVEK